MKRIVAFALFVVSGFLPYAAHAALNFTNANSNIVRMTPATNINTLATGSFLMWVYPTNTATTARIFAKSNNVATGWFFSMNDTIGNFRFSMGRSTALTNHVTNSTPFATANKWYCLAVSWDLNGATGQRINIYTGDLTTPLVEATYGTAADGSGTQPSDSAVDLAIGNVPSATPNVAFPGYIANTILINRTLSIGELISLQYFPRVVSGTVGYWNLGFNGTGTQTDYSGAGNPGTVTGATVAPLHVPLGPVFAR